MKTIWESECISVCQFFFLNWSIVDLHYGVSFRYIAKWFHYLYIYICIYIYISPWISFHYKLSLDINTLSVLMYYIQMQVIHPTQFFDHLLWVRHVSDDEGTKKLRHTLHQAHSLRKRPTGKQVITTQCGKCHDKGRADCLKRRRGPLYQLSIAANHVTLKLSSLQQALIISSVYWE